MIRSSSLTALCFRCLWLYLGWIFGRSFDNTDNGCKFIGIENNDIDNNIEIFGWWVNEEKEID